MRRVDFKGALEKIETVLPKIIAAVLAVITVVGLGVAILTAYFGVPMGDDYLAIKTYSNKHTWVAESWHSLTNTGRYMQSATSSFAYGAFRDNIGVILPSIVMAWLYVLIVLYLRLANKKFRLSIHKAGIYAIAAPILFIFMSAGRPDGVNHLWFAYQPFFFSSAIVTYTIGVLLYLSLLYSVLTSGWFSKKTIVVKSTLVFIATYILGLYNETTPATAFGISVLALLIIAFAPIVKNKLKHQYIALLSSTAAASVFALVTMYFSPSSIARRQNLTSLGTDRSNLVESVLTNFNTTISSLMLRPSDIALMFIICIVFYILVIPKQARVMFKPAKLGLVGVLVLATGLLSLLGTLSLLGLGYGSTVSILPRTLLIPQLVIGVGLFILGLSLLSRLYSYSKKLGWLQAGALIVFTVGAVVIMPHHVSRSAGHLIGAQDYNAIWQQQNSELRELSKTNPDKTIYLKDEGAGIGDGFSTKCTGPAAKYTIWLADGMESYYGLREICAQSDLKEPVRE